MDKKQFEAKKAIIDKHRGLIDALMADVEKELAEAEKPELRHGDWWIKEGVGINIFLKEHVGARREFVATKDFVLTNIGSDYNGEPILGNIFDDLKALSEPLLSFQADVHTYSFDFINLPQTPIQIAGNWHTLKEAKEICMKIQRVIYTAKQSKAKNES